jgi:serine protease inhibitor
LCTSNVNTLANKDLVVPHGFINPCALLFQVLEKMGVGDLFQETSDFSTLSETLKGPLGSALHKARIEVNEEGTKAAAATVLFSFRSSRPAEPAQFHCNHPFIYVLYDKVEKAVLFTGVFRRPH